MCLFRVNIVEMYLITCRKNQLAAEQVRLLAHSSADPIQPDESKSVKICKEQSVAVIYRKYSFVFYTLD